MEESAQWTSSVFSIDPSMISIDDRYGEDIGGASSREVRPFPVRISVMTLNLWGEHYWPSRSEALSDLLHSIKPDILFVQEATPDILKYIETILDSHSYIKPSIHSPGVYRELVEGWENECNIFWDNNLFMMENYGADSLHVKEYPLRCLFWARLVAKSNTDIKLFCSTVHFPWAGCETELRTGINQRIGCSYKVCEYLRQHVQADECIILGGDFNDDFHPIRILNDEMGLIDVFEALDLPPPITHPVRPSDAREEARPSRTIDWITCWLPPNARVIGAFVKGIRGGKFPPVSDHYPVVAFIEIIPP